MILIYDNYDSFTYNLLDYVQQLGAKTVVVRNDRLHLDELKTHDIKGIILSPGPGRPYQAGNMMELIKHAIEKQIPILGICLGHQAIAEYFGAQLVKAKLPMHGKTSLIKHNGHLSFLGIPIEFTAMRYHSLIVENIDHTILLPTAGTHAGELMAFAHPTQIIWGLQFHPESVGTPYGKTIIANWLKAL